MYMIYMFIYMKKGRMDSSIRLRAYCCIVRKLVGKTILQCDVESLNAQNP